MKMKQNICSILSLLLLLFATVACSDDDNKIEVDEEWKALNEEAFRQIENNSEYTPIKSEGNEGFVYYKVLEKGEGTEKIYFGSKVNVYYQLYLIDNPETPIQSVSRDDAKPFTAQVDYSKDGVIRGWVTVLQHMVVGDKWEVYIPQELGYGRSGSGTILPYSTLRFIIEIKEIVEQ